VPLSWHLLSKYASKLSSDRSESTRAGASMASTFDPAYFSAQPWMSRVQTWRAGGPATNVFAAGNRAVIEHALADEESGLRVVVNIGVYALLQLVPDGRYLNLYERPVIGEERPEPTGERVTVDQLVEVDGPNVYFGAPALGGVGVRFYGEYCIVLDLESVDPDPVLFDRDSYDVLLDPIQQDRAIIAMLRGRWSIDIQPMVLMKVLPELDHDARLTTTGTVSDLVLRDEEFIEVHLRPKQDANSEECQSFNRTNIEEIRESPEEAAVSTRLRERDADGLRVTELEHEWLLRREQVARVINASDLRFRVVTQHGRGYQWKCGHPLEVWRLPL